MSKLTFDVNYNSSSSYVIEQQNQSMHPVSNVASLALQPLSKTPKPRPLPMRLISCETQIAFNECLNKTKAKYINKWVELDVQVFFKNQFRFCGKHFQFEVKNAGISRDVLLNGEIHAVISNYFLITDAQSDQYKCLSVVIQWLRDFSLEPEVKKRKNKARESKVSNAASDLLPSANGKRRKGQQDLPLSRRRRMDVQPIDLPLLLPEVAAFQEPADPTQSWLDLEAYYSYVEPPVASLDDAPQKASSIINPLECSRWDCNGLEDFREKLKKIDEISPIRNWSNETLYSFLSLPCNFSKSLHEYYEGPFQGDIKKEVDRMRERGVGMFTLLSSEPIGTIVSYVFGNPLLDSPNKCVLAEFLIELRDYLNKEQ